ncbi:MAG TPA: hypothetical protein DSN98_04085 [Thermoplasmata archaeon]|nr:MAG TPA: hypothetical protein DSN98_04085 [Thermoplasmata archaeon]
MFVILGSSVTAVYISRLELQKSHEIASSLDYHEIEQLLYCAEADITNALNIAGMDGFQEIGKKPVIISSIGLAEDINRYRVKEIIKEELNVYLTGHYLYNVFSDGRYAINVVLFNESPIIGAENITLESFAMQLKRPTIPLIGPNETMNHSTYWVASVPLTIDIWSLKGDMWERVTTRSIVISSILTSRYPLMESLMSEYNQTINGTFSPLWTFTTVFSNLYSLARGFKHYRCGKPLNVVDNRHLAVMINSGLLLEQSLVFGSVDPLGLVELARKTKQMLKQNPQDVLSTFNNEMEGDGYVVNTSNVTQGSANVDAEDLINKSIDQCLLINLSEIAERILYNITAVTLHFEDETGGFRDELVLFDDNIQATLDEAIQRWANQSFFLTKVTKHLAINTTALNELQMIISEIYRDTMSTKIIDRHVVTEVWGKPGEGWTDGGGSIWNATSFIALSKQDLKPPKGQIKPGYALYEELYNVSYERIHFWWQMQGQMVNDSIVEIKVWNNVTDLLEESVSLQSLLQNYTVYRGSQNDVVDILYYNGTLNDPNLEETLNSYLALYPDSSPEKQEMITNRSNARTTGLAVELSGSYEGWVLDEAWDALDEILGSIRNITLDPSINTANYPNPVLLVEMAKNDLITKYNVHVAEYLDYSSYHPGPDFCSVGKKAVYYSREWYASFVKNTSDAVFSQITAQLTSAIEAAIPPDVYLHSKNITETLDDASDAIQNQFTIPFGYNMTLTRFDAQGTFPWNETVRLAVDQYPNYLDPFEKTQWGNEELWSLKIRNRCMLGPTGLPILPPSPVSPWLLTLNLWVLDVQGEYANFKIIDSSDETIFNPLLGHEPQTYERELKVITVANTTLGENTRISFGFTTVAFGLVPPWGMMVGDIQENWFDDHTMGFDEGQ